MKILIFSKYSNKGASSRLRLNQYIPFLENNEIVVTQSCLFDDVYLDNLYLNKKRSYLSLFLMYFKRFFKLFVVYKFDLLWIEKELFPGLPAIFERFFNIIGVKFVVDYDDAVFHNYDLSNSKVLRALLSKKIDVVMHSASTVVVGNKYLADRAMKAGAKKVVIIPTVIDLERYKCEPQSKVKYPVIGWIGSPSTQKYVIGISKVLENVCQKFGAKLLLVGADKNIADCFSNVDLEIISWTESTEVDLINKFDIGIMPLPDGPWEKGKCGYKLIQYMACGIPVVASPVGVNSDIVTRNSCGYLATTLDEWEASLIALLLSDEERKKYGLAGRNAVETEYCVQVQSEKHINLFNNLFWVGTP